MTRFTLTPPSHRHRVRSYPTSHDQPAATLQTLQARASLVPPHSPGVRACRACSAHASFRHSGAPQFPLGYVLEPASRTRCWPLRLCMSVPPPGGNGTMRRIGLSGNVPGVAAPATGTAQYSAAKDIKRAYAYIQFSKERGSAVSRTHAATATHLANGAALSRQHGFSQEQHFCSLHGNVVIRYSLRIIASPPIKEHS